MSQYEQPSESNIGHISREKHSLCLHTGKYCNCKTYSDLVELWIPFGQQFPTVLVRKYMILLLYMTLYDTTWLRKLIVIGTIW